jgi:hypothetical protein
MEPERDLAQSVQHVHHPFGDVREVRALLPQLGRHGLLRGAHLERERDELLLHAVVEVALDPPSCRVGRGEDPRPRGVELGPALGVRDGGRHELGEPGKAFLGVGRQRLVGRRRGSDDTLYHCGAIVLPLGYTVHEVSTAGGIPTARR